jgi:hypothetical protein
MDYYPFDPTPATVVTFSPTFDGNIYNISVSWSVARHGYYVNCYDSNGAHIFSVPLTESLPALEIGSLVYDATIPVTRAKLNTPHGYRPGTMVITVIEGTTPLDYSGTYMCLCEDRSTISWWSPNYPGPPKQYGQANFMISMTAGYFNSTLIFRHNRFEVRP